VAEAAARRTRRTGDEVRALILEAAREVFAQEGYAGATTRQIATRAGIAEPLIFRNFADKAGLFRHAVFDPFEAFIRGYAAQANAHSAEWDGRRHLDDALARLYVEGLYDHLRANRALLRALLRTSDEDAGALDAAVPLRRLFDELERVATNGLEAAGFQATEVDLVVRFTFGLVLSVAVLDDWLLPRGRRRPSRQRIVDELVAYVTLGVNRYPLMPPQARPAGGTASRRRSPQAEVAAEPQHATSPRMPEAPRRRRR
jgi:AcrR family transcriptional regulator